MKIGIFSSRTNPLIGGGYTFENQILRSLDKHAQESHHNFTVIVPRLNAIDLVEAEPKSISVVGLSPSNFFSRITRRISNRVLGRMPLLLAPYLHSNLLDSTAEKLGIQFLVLFSSHHIPSDIPYALVVWDIEHRVQPWFPELSQHGIWAQREICHATVIQRAACVITGTETGREEIEFFYRIPRKRIKILPHPTPLIGEAALLPDRIALREKYGLNGNFLLYPANFWAHKNHANLLMALKYLRETLDLNLSLVLTGHDMGNEPYIRQLSNNLGLDGQVHFLGFTNHQLLVSLYKTAFALTYLSFGGPENLPPLEAFALGCPVIAADIPGAREQLENSALLVDPKNPEQIARAIKGLHEDPEFRRTLIAKGKERARRFTGDDFVRGLFTIFDEFEPIRRCWSTN